MGQVLPLVGVTACRRMIGAHPFHIAGDKYLRAVADGANAMPLVIPAFGAQIEIERLLDRLDGVLVTGSVSNVEPARYGGPPSVAGTAHDPARDATTLPLIRAAIDAGVPLLGICRGHQELNVAFGGTLHQRVQEVPGLLDHRAPPEQPPEVGYAPAHKVTLSRGGLLAHLTGETELTVNSIHSQGIDRLGTGLVIEAMASDGLVEAVAVEGAPAFAVSVQWHPEWRFGENAASTALFEAFGKAVADRAAARR